MLMNESRPITESAFQIRCRDDFYPILSGSPPTNNSSWGLRWVLELISGRHRAAKFQKMIGMRL